MSRRTGELIALVRSPSTLGQRAAVNSGWLIGEQFARMAVTFVITVLIIRHLGATDYGILAYGIALILIIDVVATLGMRSVMVREILNHPDDEPEIVGTAIALRLLSSVLIAAGVIAVLWAVDPVSDTLPVLLVLALALPLWSFTALELPFQARLQSHYAVFARLSGFAVASVLRLGLLVAGAPLMAFAVATTIEFILAGVFFIAIYQYRERAVRAFRVTRSMAKRLIGLSWPLFISALAATVYLKVDQVMLLHIVDPTEVGVYAAGARISEIWYVIPIAISSSLLPVLVSRYQEGEAAYRSALQRGFDVTCWLAIALAVSVTLAAPLVVLLYGAEFERTVDILRIHVWAAPFIFMSNVLSRALITEDRRRFELTRHSAGAVLNVTLNFLLIPPFGGIGAALATVGSYSFSSYIACFLYRPAWGHARLMTRAIALPLRRKGSGDMSSRPTHEPAAWNAVRPEHDPSDREPPRPQRNGDGETNDSHAHTTATRTATNETAESAARDRISLERTNGHQPSPLTIDVPTVPEPSLAYFAVKRSMDILVAGSLLLLLAPLMAVLALAIKTTSPGPVLFTQERCGLRGRRFQVFKFRSMRRDAESRMQEVRDLDVTNGPTFKSPVDPRVTAVGRLMRRYSLDEVPQLWHVLTGDMSLVGPRPLITRETEQLPGWALARLAAKPGLTCTWQVSGRSLIPFEEWMELDVQYVHRRSLWLDLKLLVKTPAAVLSGRGAF